jgi:hypothetical protein
MQRILLATAFFLFLAGPVTADEFLVNGDFEQSLDVGWTDTIVSSAGLGTIERSDTLGQPTPGNAVRVYKYLAQFSSLSQTVDVPSTDVSLTFDARFRIGGGSSTCWPVASFWVRYIDASGVELGNTRYYLHDQYATWAKSDTVSLFQVTDTGVWRNYSLNIAQELNTNLPGVNPSNVAKLCVDIFAYDNGT